MRVSRVEEVRRGGWGGEIVACAELLQSGRSVVQSLGKRCRRRRTLAQLQSPLVWWCIFRFGARLLGRTTGWTCGCEPDFREDVAVGLDLRKRTAW